MDQQKRLFLTLALSFVLVAGFQVFFWGPQVEAERAAQAQEASSSVAAPGDGGAAIDERRAEAVPQAIDGASPLPEVAAQPAEAIPSRTLQSKRLTTALELTSEGGFFTSAMLLGPRERHEESLTIAEGYRKLFGATFPPPPQVNLAQSPAQGPGHFSVSMAGASPINPRQPYAVLEEVPGRLVFQARSGPWTVTKTFRWADAAGDGIKGGKLASSAYTYVLEVALRNESAASQSGDLVLHTARNIEPNTEQAPSMLGSLGNQASVLCRSDEKVHRLAPTENGEDGEQRGKVAFVGIDQQYFLSALWPLDGPVDGRCALRAHPHLRRADLVLPVEVKPGESWTRSFGIFLGPKDTDVLQSVSASLGASGDAPAASARAAQHPMLDSTVDFGWWAAICRVLNFFLRAFHGLLGNWGLAIIALTVMVKVVLLPLTHKAMVSAEQMKKLQPQMELLKQKYANDRERQNLEMMKLYQEAKVNPLGGCLPMLVQLPIWMALFTTLRTSYELYGEPFFGVWSDLTSPDPTYLLPLALGVTMIVTQRLQPQMLDKSQAFMITWVMPVAFTALMLNYPAGLALYIFTNNLLSIVQQYALKRYLAGQPSGKAATEGLS